MIDRRVATDHRGRRLRAVLVGVPALLLVVAVCVAVGQTAALAVAGLVAVVAGFVALVGTRGGAAASGGRRGAVVVLAIGGAGAFLGGTAFGAPVVNEADGHRPAVTASPSPTAPAGEALAALAALRVKAPAPRTGYDRERRFGAAWSDADANGCSTRDDVLRRDLTERVISRCRVLSGVLHDPYTGRTIDFLRGRRTSAAVQIDHVVSLANAWRTGARALPAARRIALANDPLDLLAVDGRADARKGDGDAATWLPPKKASRCDYVARQIAVKAAYGLWVTRAEGAAMRRVLARCPGEALPTTAPTERAAVVRGGSACPTAGATAVNRSGRPVVCLLSGSKDELLWRRAPQPAG